MKTKLELNNKDIIGIIAEKFNVKPKAVKLEVKHISGDRPWESSYDEVSVVVTTNNTDAE